MVGHSRTNIHYELLKPNEKLNSEKYCQQLDNLKTAVRKKRPAMLNRKDMILHHDNVRPHAALGTRQKIAEVGWEILSHPPYSSDIAPSDYHLFLSLQNFLAKNSKMKKMSNKHWFNFSHQKMKHFSKMEYTNCPHAGNRSLIIMAIILFNKVNWR